jgi:hypothetical protein
MTKRETASNDKVTDSDEQHLFQAIGEFIFGFSQLEFTIRARLAGALELEEELFNIIIGPYDFAMLCTVTRETLKIGANEDRAKIDAFFNKCQDLNLSARVIIAHGMWTTSGARHLSRQTLKTNFHFESVEQIKTKSELARQLMTELFIKGVPPRARGTEPHSIRSAIAAKSKTKTSK